MMQDRTDWLAQRLLVLAGTRSPLDWPSAPELRRRARRRRARRRRVATTVTVLVVAGGLIGADVLDKAASVSPGANTGLRVIARSGSAIELAANASGLAPGVGRRTRTQLAAEEVRFSLSLLGRASAASQGNNVVTSPSSLATALAMLELGARGSTADQISQALGTLNLSATEQAAAWRSLTGSENRAARQTGIDLKTANGLWAQHGLPMVPAFMSALRTYFDAGVWQVNFANDPQAAIRALNAWASTRTHGRITELFRPGIIDPSTRLVLANASYLKAAWAHPFDPGLTATGLFHLGAGGTASVPFMHLFGPVRLPATAGAGFDAVQLPYHGGRFAALVIMPTVGSLSGFLHALTPVALGRLVSGLRMTNLDLSLPRFRLRDDRIMNSVLQSMGIRAAFGNADLTGMSAVGGMFVKAVEQRTFLKVTEQGTEAATTTGIGIDLSAGHLPGIKLSVDHPFLFLIRDTNTGAILFSCTVENPG